MFCTYRIIDGQKGVWKNESFSHALLRVSEVFNDLRRTISAGHIDTIYDTIYNIDKRY